MKSIYTVLSAVVLILLMSFTTWAQNDRYQLYVVHEDHIKDGKMDQHHKGDMDIVKAAKDNNMKGMDWITFVADDGRVMYLSPIKNMGELDNNPFGDLEKKMGKEEFDKLFDSYDGTYSKHGDYILRLDNELSYMPDGMTTTPEGENYRRLVFYHIPPEHAEKAEEIAKEAKKLYTDKNAKSHYRVYKSGFGNMGSFFMVAASAKSEQEMNSKREETKNLLGKEGETLRKKIEDTFTDIEVVTGHIKPELSYVQN